MTRRKPWIELSLRPYPGRLFYTPTKQGYEQAHEELFRHPDTLTCEQDGRFSGGEGKDGLWTYLIWAGKPHALVHEVAHVVLHTFERCGIDPRECNGEPFCYLLGQLMLDIRRGGK